MKLISALAATLAAPSILLATSIPTSSVTTQREVGSYNNEHQTPAHEDNPIAQRGCVIRFSELSDTGNSVIPTIHANSTHRCVGVETVRADWSTDPDRGKLILTHGDGLSEVVSMTVDEDETLTSKGIRCGGSGGGNVTKIECYNADGDFVPAWSLEMYSPWANIWFSADMWAD